MAIGGKIIIACTWSYFTQSKYAPGARQQVSPMIGVVLELCVRLQRGRLLTPAVRRVTVHMEVGQYLIVKISPVGTIDGHHVGTGCFVIHT